VEDVLVVLPAPEAAWSGPDGLFGRLAGRWELLRRIAPEGELRGIAVFSAGEGGRLDYAERGELSLPGGFRAPAERRYLFFPRAAGFAVFFAERPPRPFHEVTLAADRRGRLLGRARHRCAADLYLTSYAFLPDGSFVIRHRVRGPRKAYCLTSRYRRAD